VIKPEEGASLARALGPHWMVLMKRHGVTVAGSTVRDCVFRSIYSTRNAEYQVRAMLLGAIEGLSPGETKLAGAISGTTTGLVRSWEYWSMRVAKAGGAVAEAKGSGPSAKPARAKVKAASKAASKPASKSASKSASKPARAKSRPKRAAKSRRR
jgi:hypothetical protein